jgi:hypothetical protein
VGVDPWPAEIFEQVIVKVRAVERRLGRTDLVQIGEIVVDKMREGLRWVHA